MAGLPEVPERHCLRCGMDTARPELGCGYCLNEGWCADAAYFAFLYEDAVADLIVGFKFGDHPDWAVLLGGLFWQRLGSVLRWETPDLVVPIPLHPWRLIHRRYNQSALLARELARFLSCPLVTNGLKRIKMTAPQTRLDSRRRRENVQGAFQVDPRVVAGRSVLLVDDVFTTGATMGAAVRCLKEAGAVRVAMACLARPNPGRGDLNLQGGKTNG